jgi:hypothetical protein
VHVPGAEEIAQHIGAGISARDAINVEREARI